MPSRVVVPAVWVNEPVLDQVVPATLISEVVDTVPAVSVKLPFTSKLAGSVKVVPVLLRTRLP